MKSSTYRRKIKSKNNKKRTKFRQNKTKKKRGGQSYSQFSDEAHLGPDDEDQLVKQRRERKKRSAVMEAVMQPKTELELCQEERKKDMEKITKWLDQQFAELNIKVKKR